MNSIFKSEYRRCFFLALLVNILCAWFSMGYHTPDEHFQILEFANYKSGNSPAADLPWEYQKQIRPAAQPAFVFLLMLGLKFFGLINPFIIAFLLRLIVGIAAWYIICRLVMMLSTEMKTEKGRKFFILMSLFLWFVPYINVRFSSENCSAVLFLYGLFLILKREEGKNKSFISLVTAGFLFGFSFFARFQMIFGIAGFIAWYFIIKKTNWKNIFTISIFALIAIALNVFIDSYFYGEWVFTPLNYYRVNIIEDMAARGWDVAPWWYYFATFFKSAVPLLSIFLLIFFLTGLFKNLKSAMVWTIIPFIIVHCIVGHKEMRFMFPVVFPFIYISALGLDFLFTKPWYSKIHRFVFVISVIIIIPLLTYVTFSPAQVAVKYYKYLYDRVPEEASTVISFKKDIYSLVGLNVNFYKPKGIQTITLDSINQFDEYILAHPVKTFFFISDNASFDHDIKGYKKEKAYSVFPEWLLKFKMNNWQARTKVLTIYKFSLVDKGN